MKPRFLALVLAATGLALSVATRVPAQDTVSPAGAELRALVTQIQTKLSAGQSSAAELAPDLAAFDRLVAKYKAEKTEDVAEISLSRAALYLQILGDEVKGRAMLQQIKVDFPQTKVAAAVDGLLAQIDQAAQQRLAKTTVVGKPAPELNFTWSSRPALAKLSDLKGKVVVIDFWATWCGPCIRSFPEVAELVAHYKGSEVVILGVTSLQGFVANLEPGRIDTSGNPAKEYELMPTFMKAKGMTWDVAFSKEEVFNPAYGIAGIPHMTIIAPDGTVRHNDLHPAAPTEEKTGRIDALLKEFGLKVPVAKKS